MVVIIYQEKRLSIRDKESLKTLKKLGLKKENIFFIGRELGIDHYSLYLNLDKVSKRIYEIIQNWSAEFNYHAFMEGDMKIMMRVI